MYYIGCNLAIGATITYVALWYRESIVKAAREFRRGAVDDAHYAKMRVYKEVPMCVLPPQCLLQDERRERGAD